MDPFSMTLGVETVSQVVGTLFKSRQYAIDLLDAVRGARNMKSVWYALCKELGDNCEIILPLLDSITAEVKHGGHSHDTTDAIHDAVEALNSAVVEGTKLVVECQDASTVALFFRGESLREKFRKVAERIARCLRTLPLAALRSTMAIERDVSTICRQLENARFELSEEDRGLLEATHHAVGQQGERSDTNHQAMASLLQQMENRLDMKVIDMRQEMRVNSGEGAVDLDAKEQKFMAQISVLLSSVASAASGSR